MARMKKIISAVLVIALVIAMIPMGFTKEPVHVKAEVSGIESGATYKIISAYNGKAITQTDVSDYWADCVVWNTDAMSDLARWKVEASGEYYTITNIVTNKTMKTTGTNRGDKLDLNGNDGADRYKWKLVPITSGTYAGCFFIVSAEKNSDGEEMYAEIISDDDKRDKDGAQVRLWTKVTSIDYEPRQIWKFEKSDAEYTEFTETMSDEMLEAYAKQNYVDNVDTGGKTLYTDDKDWGMAEELEALLDGYETTGKEIYRTMFRAVFDDFLSNSAEYNGGDYAQKRNGSARSGGEDWTKNPANDDITWYVIAAVRAYILFGVEKYLTVGKQNFDKMYERASTNPDNHGMLIWNMDAGNGSLSCINGPAAVAACYLAIATGDESYYTKAKTVYDAWRNSGMYVAEGEDIGHVKDGGYEGGYPCTTYNQATFIGAATMLYEYYGDESYYKDACDAVEHTLKTVEDEEITLENGQTFRDGFCYNNILVREAIQKGQDALVGDMGKFRGILMRYLRKFIVDFNKGEYLDFFKDNAKIAWMNRNSKGLAWCEWNKKAPEDGVWQTVSYVSSNALSLVANMPTYADTLERDAYSTIEAENMDYTHGLISEDSSGTSGGRSLGGITDGCYTAYYNVDFGETGSSKIKIRYSRETESEGESGVVEFRLGSTDGTIIARINLENTGSWSDWREITVDAARATGLQNVYAVFKSTTAHVCNLDYFVFEKADASNNPDTGKENIVISADVKVEGYQISTTLGGNRVVGSVEPEINKKTVVGWGLVYGLSKNGTTDYMLQDADMYVGSANEYVKSYESTSEGTLSTQMGDSSTATYFVRTMLFAAYTKEAFETEYKVRAYALLSDGSYAYSDVVSYSIFDVSKYLYNNVIMNTYNGHKYLYDNILTVVDSGFAAVDYAWGNNVVKPEKAE